MALVHSHILPLHALLYPAALSPFYYHTAGSCGSGGSGAVSGGERWKEAKGAQLELTVSSRTEEEVTLFRVLMKARAPCSPVPPFPP